MDLGGGESSGGLESSSAHEYLARVAWLPDGRLTAQVLTGHRARSLSGPPTHSLLLADVQGLVH